MDEQRFRTLANDALESLNDKLGAAGEQFGFEVDLQQGALKIDFDDPPGRFVVSPNAPVKQIWISALVKSFKLDWDASRHAFVLAATSQSLDELLAALISQQIGETVAL